VKATTKGTLICSACAVIVISAKPPGEVAMIIVAIGKLKAHARNAAAITEATRMKIEL
jgi:hypothetical protein